MRGVHFARQKEEFTRGDRRCSLFLPLSPLKSAEAPAECGESKPGIEDVGGGGVVEDEEEDEEEDVYTGCS